MGEHVAIELLVEYAALMKRARAHANDNGRAKSGTELGADGRRRTKITSMSDLYMAMPHKPDQPAPATTTEAK
jgi:hypothetical protein